MFFFSPIYALYIAGNVGNWVTVKNIKEAVSLDNH